MKPVSNISFDLQDPIFTVCRTTWERRKILEELRNIEHNLYSDEKDDINMIIRKVCRESTYEIIKRIVGEEQAKYINRMRTIGLALLSIPELELSLAFEPTVIFIQHIWNKITQASNKPLILDIHYEPLLIGGATMTYNGLYGDFSLRQKVETILQPQ